MKNAPDEVKQWEQLQLLGGGPVEFTLRVGAFPEADHCQFELEVTAAGTGELLALSSRHHMAWSDRQDELLRWFKALSAAIERHTDPFPTERLAG